MFTFCGDLPSCTLANLKFTGTGKPIGPTSSACVFGFCVFLSIGVSGKSTHRGRKKGGVSDLPNDVEKR